ncbi:uncharacterized protein V1518DRAFT_409163 [Limtongia smithiae]|uniref:uncharacterized protein n=1 Tax=Limtongia smithiae TaxID=1125753 RepID=UPI0034CDA729
MSWSSASVGGDKPDGTMDHSVLPAYTADFSSTQPPQRSGSPASSASGASYGRGRRPRRGSVAISESSYYSEMAQDGPFDGPAPEGVPSAISSFPHRNSTSRSRSRSLSSTRSFRFFDGRAVERANEIDMNIHGYRYDDALEQPFENGGEYATDLSAFEAGGMDSDDETHSLHSVLPDGSFRRRLQSNGSMDHSKQFNNRDSTARPLLNGRDSYDRVVPEILQQTVYLPEEDMIIALAGYKTNKLRYALFLFLCLATGGVVYLILRWIPKWRLYMIGTRVPICNCDWVVLENQWGELSFHNITKISYNFPMSTVFALRKSASDLTTSQDVQDPLIPMLHYFDYRYMRLFLHPIEGKFELNFDWKDPSWSDPRRSRRGLDSAMADERALVFGENAIDIEDKTIVELLVEEVLHPFYIFQLFSMILWSLDEYYYYATCIFVISVISITNALIETKTNMTRMREISKFVCNVRVLRDGFWVIIPSSQMVPGDIYEISDPSLTVFPCDAIQLTGDSIVNESMLTGESIPVTKLSATPETLNLLMDSNMSSIVPELAKNFLFSGTKIVRVRKTTRSETTTQAPRTGSSNANDANDDEDNNKGVAYALVVRTGFNTTKGALVRSMLFPKPSGFKFYRDSFRYIAVMAAMAAVGFVFYTVTFIKLGLPASLIAFRSLDLITIVVPPALPATLTIGTNIALSRLKRKSIFCISPNRVNVGGKLDIVCFDKTGTLTEEGLDVFGVHIVNKRQHIFGSLLGNASVVLPTNAKNMDADWALQTNMLFAMATCHSLRLIDGELLGDPMDYKMFAFTMWSFEEDGEVFKPSNESIPESEYDNRSPSMDSPMRASSELGVTVVHPPPSLARALIASYTHAEDKGLVQADLGIVRSFEFVSGLRRMSVLVRRLHDPDLLAYVKGAPEVMPSICRPETLPDDYNELLQNYTHKGYRVIGVAFKKLRRVNWLKAQKLKREDVEADLEFVGLIVFENKLKPSTASIINELDEANIRTVMCTGDNVLTAISVGRECGLVNRTALVFAPHIDEALASLGAHSSADVLRWECIDDPRVVLDSTTLLPRPTPGSVMADLQRDHEYGSLRNYTLAVTGDAFRWIINHGSETTIQRMLIQASIYARMSPDEKHELVEKLQGIDYTVCFCGDGANDCGALKAADVGISLSEAEASVAAPFTSRIFEISCVPDVIREGRASLVTSFSCFKYMSLYSAIQFSTVGILYGSGTNLGDFQFLMIDMFLILPIAVFMAWSNPYPVLSTKRPTANLVSQKILVNLIGQIVINVGFQFLIWRLVKQQPFYTPPVPGSDDSHVQSSDNTALFLASCFQYIFIAMVLSVGPPYREAMTKNIPFMATIVVTTTLIICVLFVPPRWIFNLLVLTDMSFFFKGVILVVGAINFVGSMAGEKYVFPMLASSMTNMRRYIRGGRRKVRKQFKVLSEEHEKELSCL